MFGFKRSNQEELSEKETEKVNEKFNSFKNKAYSEEDMHKVFDNEENILNKVMNDKNLKQFIEEIKLFFCMLKDFFTKKYTEVPVGTIMAIVGSLLYVLAPIDIIPDFIPVVGYLDDAGIIALCMNFVKTDLNKYKDFKGLN